MHAVWFQRAQISPWMVISMSNGYTHNILSRKSVAEAFRDNLVNWSRHGLGSVQRPGQLRLGHSISVVSKLVFAEHTLAFPLLLAMLIMASGHD